MVRHICDGLSEKLIYFLNAIKDQDNKGMVGQIIANAATEIGEDSGRHFIIECLKLGDDLSNEALNHVDSMIQIMEKDQQNSVSIALLNQLATNENHRLLIKGINGLKTKTDSALYTNWVSQIKNPEFYNQSNQTENEKQVILSIIMSLDVQALNSILNTLKENSTLVSHFNGHRQLAVAIEEELKKKHRSS